MDTELPNTTNNLGAEPTVSNAREQSPNSLQNHDLLKQNKFLKSLVTIMALVLLLIVGAVVYMFTKQNIGVKPMVETTDNTPKPTAFTPSQRLTPSPLPTNVTDVSINWETYTSPKQEYSFKHPSGLKSDTEAAGTGQESIRFIYMGEDQGRKEGMLNDGYSFVVTKIITSMTAQEQAQKERDTTESGCISNTNTDSRISQLIEIQLDGHQAWQYTTKECLADNTNIYVENSDGVLRISLLYPGVTPLKQAQYEEILNQILSTFKFVDTNKE